MKIKTTTPKSNTKKKALQTPIISPNLYKAILISLITIAIAIQGGAKIPFLTDESEIKYEVRLADIQKVFPDAKKFSESNAKDYYALTEQNDTLGTVTPSFEYAKGIKGFAGEVPLLIGYNKQKLIRKIILLENDESEEYMDYIVDEKLLYRWDNKTISEAQLLKVDAITAATETSEGIINGVQYTLSGISGVAPIKHQTDWKEILQFILTLGTILFALAVCFIRKMKRYRIAMLICIAVVMGFMYQTMISASLLHGWAIHGPPWNSNTLIVLLLFLSIILPLTTKKQFYCHYMCPYGAVQELAGKVSPFKKRNMNWLKWKGIPFQTIFCTILIIGLLVGVYPELSFIEPFPSFSYKVVSWWMIGFGGVFIGLSFFYSKPWCKICPTGFFLDSCKKGSKKKQENLLFNMKSSELLNILLVLVIIILLLKVGNGNLINTNTEEPSTETVNNSLTSTIDSLHFKKSIGIRPVMFPVPAVVIGSYNKDKVPNLMSASWAGIVNSKPLSMAISLRESTHTYSNVMESKAFTLNYASEKLLPYVDWVGHYSGKDVNKFDALSLTPVSSLLVNAPYVKEFPVIVECKVIKVQKLGRHTQFIGEVLDVKADTSVLKNDHVVNIEKMKPILVASGNGFYGFGKHLGRGGKLHQKLNKPVKKKQK